MLAFELCGASIHPGEPLRVKPDLGVDRGGPYVDRVPRSRHRDLRQAYIEDCLDGSLERLSHELRQEDRVQAEFQRFLSGQANGPRWMSSYAEPLAFAGGGSQLVRQIETCAALVEEAFARTPCGAPRFYCGLMPNVGLGARSYAVGDGVVVLLDTGFLAALRIFIQTMASSLDTIRHVREKWIDGDMSLDMQYGSLQDLLNRCDAGQDVRDDPIQIRVDTGPQDYVRRHAMLSAICQIIAHEVAHWARSRLGPNRTWVPNNAEYQRAARVTSYEQLARPINDNDEIVTPIAEHYADTIACVVQMQSPLWSGEPKMGQVMGAMSSLALHAGLWWKRAAHTDRDLGWTHPNPELRMGMVGLVLADSNELTRILAERPDPAAFDEPGPGGEFVERFDMWAGTMLHIPQNRSVALKRGLADRGLTRGDRMAIHLAWGGLEETP